MMNRKDKAWNPYLVGTLLGVLSWAAYASAGKLLGITTPFENTAALAGKTVDTEITQAHPYFLSSDAHPGIDWEWMLVLGVFLGAWISSKASGDRKHPAIHAIWQARFGSSVARRYVGAFMGGAIMMFGARLAKGCTSGHGISGILQFAVSSQVFVVVFGVTGIIFARALYGKQVSEEVFGPVRSREQRGELYAE